MEEASFQSILRVILIILLIYFGLKIIFRWFGPMILKYILKRLGRKFQRQFNQQFNQQAPQNGKKTGEVVIEKKPSKSRKTNNNTGEYIDYEEID